MFNFNLILLYMVVISVESVMDSSFQINKSGEAFKYYIDELKSVEKLDLVFLIDGSSSVGEKNFKNELKFVKKLLSDVTVDYNHARIAIITFSSSDKIIKNIDEISKPRKENNKCLLLHKQLTSIKYTGGGTYTLGAFQLAKEIFSKSRNDTKKALFLITDGFSNGGDPTSLANELKSNRITIFTIGVQNGNYKELYELSSTPGEYHSYLLDSFREFENLARRALHVDLKSGDYIPLGVNHPCDQLCDEGDCCDIHALCACGTTTGHYSCICKPGYYGTGLRNLCKPCPTGTYSNGTNLCLACPDENHITRPAAIGVESCKCKSGYKVTKNNRCKILRCPDLSNPEHGYLIKRKECSNDLNSACAFRCEVGYTLIGHASRKCQDNATWSGIDPYCRIKTCSKLPPLPHGSMKCFNNDLGIIYNENESRFALDTTCTFQCEKGRSLLGSFERTCLPTGKWDGFKTTCKQIKCPKLPSIANGRIEPHSCTTNKQSYGKNCTIICDEGYKVDGPANKMCTGNFGLWDSQFEDTVCKDILPPTIICPLNVTTLTLAKKKYGFAKLEKPKVSDNSGLEISIWMEPKIKDTTGFKFEVGLTKITYFAQDAFQNREKCEFYVKVEDFEKPVIENCENPPIFLTNEKGGSNITWDEPNIYDNSQTVSVIKSHQFGFFPLGTTTVVYTATDVSGNKNQCSINITVEEAHCEALTDPVFGHSECSHRNQTMQCVITCEEGYAVPLSQPENSIDDDNSISFRCDDTEAIWYNQEGLLFPECSVTQVPKEIEESGTLNIITNSEDCNNPKRLEEIENDIKVVLQDNVCEKCSLKTESDCENDSTEENTNIIKRAVDTDIVQKIRKKDKKKKLNIRFQMKGKFQANKSLSHINSEKINFTLINHQITITCALGFISRRSRCVQCPRGTFHNTRRNKCESCHFGYYSSRPGQASCTPCPLYFSTNKRHAKKVGDCRQQCLPGTHGRKKLVKQSRHQTNVTIERITLSPLCRSCPIGQYQPVYNQLKCLTCPMNYTTTSVGSTDVSQCIPTSQAICANTPNICQTGKCVTFNDFHYKCICPENYYGTNCEKKSNPCESNPCLNGGVCRFDNALTCLCPSGYSGKFCEISRERCLLRCLNKGVCVRNDANEYLCLCPKGFVGDTCEIKINHCFENLCENNGTCINEFNGYRCLCPDGFIGRRCNILPCDYKPCGEKAVCVNRIEPYARKDSYFCVCPEGFTGKLCEDRIDYCEDEPCINGGVCKNTLDYYTCHCPKVFYGPKCEKKRNFNYTISFQRFSIDNFVVLEGFEQNLTEITTCLWMKSIDNFNYGTLLSYATTHYDNAFTLTDYTGLVFYVNNFYVVTDISLNDGIWHHVCASWTSTNGKYAIHVDGKLMKYGLDLAYKTVLQGKGKLIVGQEQDVMGGKFSQSESYVGEMANIDVWSRVLTNEEILKHMNDCTDTVYGDIYAWPEIQDNIRGNVLIEKADFCRKCDYPKSVFNAVINVIDNVAYYNCDKGYQITSKIYNKGRRCTKVLKWEGTEEPYCRKTFCGYPGLVRNGYSMGDKYHYNDKITYICQDGYEMVGNNTLICTENGTWYPDKPSCVGSQCAAFKKPDNSTLLIIADHSFEDFIEEESIFDVGTQIEVICDDGTNLMGNSLITCIENGTWDYSPPTCLDKNIQIKPKVQCNLDSIPKPPNNGFINMETLYAVGNGTNNTVEYACKNGYNRIGDSGTTCIIDGYWTVPNITCEPMTCPFPMFKNMKVKNRSENDQLIMGDVVKFDCIDGYRRFGDGSVRCLENGKWSKMKAKCTRKSCRKPAVSQKTIIVGNSYLFNDEVTLLCPNKKEYVLRCNARGVWEGEKGNTC